MEWLQISKTSYDGVVLLFITSLVIFTLIKSYFPFALKEFMNLLVNNKFVIIFTKEKNILVFVLLFGFIQIIFLSIFLYVLLVKHNNFIAYNFQEQPFLQEILFVGVVIVLLIKLFLQFVVSYIFRLENIMQQYIFIRLSYSNYASMVSLGCLLFAVFGFNGALWGLVFSFLVYVGILLLGLIEFVRQNNTVIKRLGWYFFLYLCLFEVVPYLYLFKLIFKNIPITI